MVKPLFLIPPSRAAFESEGLTQAQERLTHLNTLIESEQVTLTKLEGQKVKAEDDIKASEEDIAELREELERFTRNIGREEQDC